MVLINKNIMTNQQLKTKIMRRVYLAWFINRMKPVVLLQLPLIVAFLAVQHEYVAFKAVASNSVDSLNSFSGVFDYTVSAFQNAEPLVAFLAVAIGLFMVLAGQSIIRNIAALFRKPVVLPLKVEK